jgi:hypothetical protein
MKIVIKERKQNNLIYLYDEVGSSPLTADIVSKMQTKEFVVKMLNENSKINAVHTVNMNIFDLF